VYSTMSPLKLSEEARVTGERPRIEYVSVAPSENVSVVMLNFSILTPPLDVRTRATPLKTSPVMLAEPAVMLETAAAGRALWADARLTCRRGDRLGCGDVVALGDGDGDGDTDADADGVGDGLPVGVTLGDGEGLPVGEGDALLLDVGAALGLGLPAMLARAALLASVGLPASVVLLASVLKVRLSEGDGNDDRLAADSAGANGPGRDAGWAAARSTMASGPARNARPW
jgi:hypothetical protein